LAFSWNLMVLYLSFLLQILLSPFLSIILDLLSSISFGFNACLCGTVMRIWDPLSRGRSCCGSMLGMLLLTDEWLVDWWCGHDSPRDSCLWAVNLSFSFRTPLTFRSTALQSWPGGIQDGRWRKGTIGTLTACPSFSYPLLDILRLNHYLARRYLPLNHSWLAVWNAFSSSVTQLLISGF